MKLTWNASVLRNTNEAKKSYSPYSVFQMLIRDVLKKVRSQLLYILKKRECNKLVLRRMLRTFFFISKQLYILRTWSLIKSLQIILVLLVMSILTYTHYKIISLTLLVICLGLVCYIIVDQFITLKQQYEDLRVSCSMDEKSQPTSSSSD